MSVSDRTVAFDEITVGQGDHTKIVNSLERLTLADQFHCMGNQAVTQGLTELAEVRNDYQANKMLSISNDVHQQLWRGHESHEKFMGDEPKPR